MFVSDTEVGAIAAQSMPGAEFHRLCGGDRAPPFPDDNVWPHDAAHVPPVGGFRVGTFRSPPGARIAPARHADDGRTFVKLLAPRPKDVRVNAL